MERNGAKGKKVCNLLARYLLPLLRILGGDLEQIIRVSQLTNNAVGGCNLAICGESGESFLWGQKDLLLYLSGPLLAHSQTCCGQAEGPVIMELVTGGTCGRIGILLPSRGCYLFC